MLSLDNKKVFVTGGTGTIGSQVVNQLLSQGALVTVYSRDQNKQFEMHYALGSNRVHFVNGCIEDKDILYRAMREHDYVIHAAASKHVPGCEKNVDSAIKINVEGTRNVLEMARHAKIKKVLFVSTDKAVYPTSVMGATKFLAERLVLEFNPTLCASVVRLGNVFGSQGSVIPTLYGQIERRLPLILNDPDAVRYFISQKNAGEFVVNRLIEMKGKEVFVPKMKKMMINDIVEAIKPSPDYPVSVRQLGWGEKLDEELFMAFELKSVHALPDYFMINGKEPNEPYYPEFHKPAFYTRTEIKKMLKEINA